jgi:NAD(P)-dependent dehydrogenase (short-subunit alcohol dehydrogenase family)
MNFWPNQPLAVVIGAGGMSMAVARRLGQHNHLLITDIDATKLEQQTTKLREEGIRAESIVCDVTNFDSVQALANRVKAIGTFSKLAHVAGLSPSMADWRTIMSVNLIGPTLVTNALSPLASTGAVAVLISSLSAHMAIPEDKVIEKLNFPLAADFLDQLNEEVGGKMTPQLAYMLSKFAIIRLCQKLAVSWGAKGARVVSVSPGLIATPQGTNEFKHATTKHDLLNKCPLQRQGGMQEIADVVEYLTSDRASYINGIDLLVDGGVRAALSQAIQS